MTCSYLPVSKSILHLKKPLSLEVLSGAYQFQHRVLTKGSYGDLLLTFLSIIAKFVEFLLSLSWLTAWEIEYKLLSLLVLIRDHEEPATS